MHASDAPSSPTNPPTTSHHDRWQLGIALGLVALSLIGNVLSANIGIFASYLVPIFCICVFCMYAFSFDL